MVQFLREDFNCTFFEMKGCTGKKKKNKNKNDNLIMLGGCFFRFPAYVMQVEGIEIPGASLLWSSLIKAAVFWLIDPRSSRDFDGL